MGSGTQPQPTGRLGAVFWVSVVVSALFVAWGITGPDHLMNTMSQALNWITEKLGWIYLITPLLVLVFLLFLAFSRFGRIRLGSDNDRPEFRTYTWIAMILCTVMGIGLVSYGVAEPVSHFTTPPHDLAKPETPKSAVVALQYSFYNWGLHAWAVFAAFGLAIGYSMYRKGRRGLVSAMFRPLLGDRVDGPLGIAIDVLTVFATLFGTTTSLGLGALQIDDGLGRLLGTPTGVTSQVVIVAIITLLFTASSASGLHRGIRYLSESNLVLAIALFIFVLLAGPTAFLINLFLESVGRYANDFVLMSLRGPAFGDLSWMRSWTFFMLAWWIAWAAFVGVFLARISKGRTIRQFVFVVLGAPSLAFFAWFAIFGGAAMKLELSGVGHVAQSTANDMNSAFLALLSNFPLPAATSAIVVILAAMFFVTSADANTFVLGMITSHGTLRPRVPVLVLWGAITGVAAIIVLIAGGLDALQQTVIVASAPFVVIIGGVVLSFWRDLKTDPAVQRPSTASIEHNRTEGANT